MKRSYIAESAKAVGALGQDRPRHADGAIRRGDALLLFRFGAWPCRRLSPELVAAEGRPAASTITAGSG